MRKSVSEKYFSQKSWTVLEWVCIVVAAVAVYVSTYVWGGYHFGMALLAVAGSAFAISKTTKITDDDITDELDRFIRDEKLPFDKDSSISVFDTEVEPVVRGRDGVFRSRSFVITSFLFGEKTEITVHRIDLIDRSVKKDYYIMVADEKLLLTSKKLITSYGNKEMYYLQNEDATFRVPVKTNDIDIWRMIVKVCGFES